MILRILPILVCIYLAILPTTIWPCINPGDPANPTNRCLHFNPADPANPINPGYLWRMYQATVNKKTFDIEPGEDGFKFQNTTVAWDIQRTGDGHYHILYGGKSYSAELVKFNAATKSFTFKINGRIYQVDVRDRFDILLEKMGMNNASAGKVNNIKAPMPGLIIELKVKPGDVVHPGDSLLILEAMKMENVIKSPGEGTVKSVKIKKGDSVEKNQVLIEF